MVSSMKMGCLCSRPHCRCICLPRLCKQYNLQLPCDKIMSDAEGSQANPDDVCELGSETEEDNDDSDGGEQEGDADADGGNEDNEENRGRKIDRGTCKRTAKMKAMKRKKIAGGRSDDSQDAVSCHPWQISFMSMSRPNLTAC